MKALKGRVAEWELPSGNDIPTIEIKQDTSRTMVLGMLLLGMLIFYCGLMIASSIGWKIPGIETAEAGRETPATNRVTEEVPTEKVIEKPVYIDRPIEKPVYINRTVQVPMQPQRIWVDSPRNIPGCFPIYIHLSYDSGESRSYSATLCGRW
jgi:hypothetical protein